MHRKVSLVDTRFAAPSHHFFHSLSDCEVLNYDLSSNDDMENYWTHLRAIILFTPLSEFPLPFYLFLWKVVGNDEMILGMSVITLTSLITLIFCRSRNGDFGRNWLVSNAFTASFVGRGHGGQGRSTGPPSYSSPYWSSCIHQVDAGVYGDDLSDELTWDWSGCVPQDQAKTWGELKQPH